MNLKKLITVMVAGLALLASGTNASAASSDTADAGLGTYNDYSRIFQRSAGQYFDTAGTWKNQWAWEPKSATESWIRWGDPATWPPASYEKFQTSADGQWVLLDGYGDSTAAAFNKQRVTRETISDVDCVSNTRDLPLVDADADGGKQHYTKWFIQPQAYCLQAWGKIFTSTGVVNFYHKQAWFEPSGPTCDNPYFSGQVCIKQYEVWEDDNPANVANSYPGGQYYNLIQQRDNIFARGLGAMYIHHNYLSNWDAYGRFYWTY